ncbi:MAG: DNA gyrase subunit A [Magnetococcales bacterium]|nr:DNA gyrase subunit A [Magnetococcales bacterium]
MTESSSESKRIPVNIEDEMERSYLDYAMSVIVGRALPDVRDGLKPVHRRVLFAMNELGNDWNKPYKKSARVVGDVIGKFHPHGDVAVYDTIVRMAQDFSMRHVLVDGQGNFGSVDGDSAAAMRYTEVRMMRLAHELLADIDKETVAFGPNYDGSLTEPLVLPAKFPNLLVNGSSGIAVGMATNIPPHNLGEVVDGVCALIDRPTMTNRDLLAFIPGPDFPTGSTIHGRSGILSAYETGRGSIVVRAQTSTEPLKDGRQALIIHELPYQVNKARLVERIAELVRDKKVIGISDLRDESDREGMRVVIELRRDAHPDVVLNQLFKHTPMQSSFGVNALALVNGQPVTLDLKGFLREFITHRREVVTRRTLFELNKARGRAHILEGLTVALANIDRVIELIRAARNPAEAQSALLAELWERGPVEAMLLAAMPASSDGLDQAGRVASPQFVDGGYRFTQEQVQAILEMRLQRLTGLEQDKIHDEFKELLAEIARLEKILANDSVLMDVIKAELLWIKSEFADARRTRIVEDAGDFSVADLIPEEETVVTVSHAGYVKRQPAEDYRAQRRGGKGKSATGIRDEDFIEQLFVASSHDTIFCFTDRGRVFRLKVYEIPAGGRTSRGKALINLLALEPGEKVRQILPSSVPKAEQNRWDMLFATRRGLVKKTALSAFANIRTNGIKAITLMEGDDLIGVALLPMLPWELAVASQDPDAESDAEGDLDGEGDESEGSEATTDDDGTDATDETLATDAGTDGEESAPDDAQRPPGRILLFSRSGKAVRFRTHAIRRMGRTARGVRGIKLKGDDQLIALTVLTPDCQVLTITEKGYGKRSQENLFPTKGRGTQGVIGLLTSIRNGPVVGALSVTNGDQVMVITDQGTLLRTPVDTIRMTGRNTQGVTILNVADNERISSVARIAESETDEGGTDQHETEAVGTNLAEITDQTGETDQTGDADQAGVLDQPGHALTGLTDPTGKTSPDKE